jgi:tRNA (mo5U34)-methyltransferase
MSKRSWRWKGFGITVELPDRRPAPPREPMDANGHVRWRELPAVVPEHRDPAQAAGFIRSAIERRRDSGRDANADTGGAEASTTLATEAAARGWYHTLELPYGVVTAGAYDHRSVVSRYGIPDDLDAKGVLDIGSSDGFWALEFERRGATVTAVDIRSAAELDLPPAVRRVVAEEQLDWRFGAEFAFARRTLGSTIEAIDMSVYDLDPNELGVFDLVHAGDLLLHLRDPVLALQRIRSVTAGNALLSDCFDPDLDKVAGRNLTRYLGGWTSVTWWQPGLSTLVQMVTDAGFSEVEVLTTYELPMVGETSGPWRAVLRATP